MPPKVRGHNSSELRARLEVQSEGPMQQHYIERMLIGVEPESVPTYKRANIGRSEAMSADLDVGFLVIYLLKNVVELYADKLVELLLCNNLDMESI